MSDLISCSNNEDNLGYPTDTEDTSDPGTSGYTENPQTLDVNNMKASRGIIPINIKWMTLWWSSIGPSIIQERY